MNLSQTTQNHFNRNRCDKLCKEANNCTIKLKNKAVYNLTFSAFIVKSSLDLKILVPLAATQQ